MRKSWLGAAAMILCGTSILLSQPGAAFDPALNIARGRPYTLSPRPNYSLTTEAGDDRQLTDGVVTTWNPIWTQTSTVGWTGVTPVTIVVDLQSVQPIAGVSYRTAAGKAEVSWPRALYVLTSDDGLAYYPVVDLVQLAQGAAGPPATGYAAFRYSTNALRTHGRYVAIVVDSIGAYSFCDEIEVLAGHRAWLASPLSGQSTTNLQQFFVAAHTESAIHRRLSDDLAAARAALAASAAGDGLRSDLEYRLNAVEADIRSDGFQAPPSFRAVLPLDDRHARIFAVQGAIAQANGLPALTAWAASPWDFVRPLDKSQPVGPDRVSIVAMNGETRSGAVSVSNSTDQPMTVWLQLTLDDGSVPADVTASEVIWTDTRELVPVADALVPLSAAAPSFGLSGGMTRQIWLRFAPSARAPGTYSGVVAMTTEDGLSASVPFELTVLPGQFPARPSLHLGGWDYTDGDRGFGLTPNNRTALIGEMRAIDVDSPWASARVMPFGQFDSLGRLTGTLDTSAFDAWVGRWPGASRYSVFLNVTDAIGNVPSADARFATAVGQWISFWAGHAASMGLGPQQLMLLLVDEPSTAVQDNRIARWAPALKAAAPSVGIWEDPTYLDPAASLPALFDLSDVLAIKRALMVQQGAPFVDFYRNRSLQGQAVEIYGASGPVRLLDPYTYHRLQAWVAADLGAASIFFWSFADDAGGHSWNEYGTTTAPYSPFFLSDNAVVPSKHSEAIREGLEDVEYLSMLRLRASGVSQIDPGRAGLADVLGLADRAAATVLQSAGATDFQWTSPKDRSSADAMRLLLADALNGATLSADGPIVPVPAPRGPTRLRPAPPRRTPRGR